MTVPVVPFEEKLASPDGTDTRPRTSISFLGRVSCAPAVTNITNRRTSDREILFCITHNFIVVYQAKELSVLTGMKRAVIFSSGEETA
jgi:hypothetical protein